MNTKSLSYAWQSGRKLNARFDQGDGVIMIPIIWCTMFLCDSVEVEVLSAVFNQFGEFGISFNRVEGVHLLQML